jgi:hypothetical protein
MKNSFTRRDVLKAATAATISAGAATNNTKAQRAVNSAIPAGTVAGGAPEAETNLPWYRRLLVGMEVGPTGANDKDGIFYSRATGKDIVEHLLKAHVEYAVIFMKDQDFAYYHSQVVRPCPNLHGRDLLGEVLDAAKPHNLPIIAYFQIQYDTAAWQAHPEWRMKDVTGKDIPFRLCYNSDYLNYNKLVMAELLEYEIAGFHVDMLDYGFSPPYGCWCENCARVFRQQFNIDIPHPPKPSWDADWEKILEFRASSNTRFSQDLHSFVKSKRPEVAVDFNYHGYPPFSWIEGELPVRQALNGDFVTCEGLPWVFGHYNPSLLSLFIAGARLGGPTQIATSRSVYNYFDPTIRPVAEMEWEVLTYAAHATQCTVVDKVNYDGTLDSLAYERLGEVFKKVRDRSEYFKHSPVQEVGLYYSSRSRDWFAREAAPQYFAAFCGAHKALVQSHITLGMIMDENVSAERLSEFPVVYLPNTAILSEREINLFDEYVSGGGNLLVTGLSGLYDRYGNLQEQSSLAGLLGMKLVKPLLGHYGNYVRLPGDLSHGDGRVLLENIPPDWAALTFGPAAVFEATQAKTYGDLLVAFRSPLEPPIAPGATPEPNIAPFSACETVGPAIFVGQRGKGKTIYVPCCPDAALMSNFRIPENRHLIRNLVRFLNPQPRVKIQAPLNVEAVVNLDKSRGRLLVHLIGFSAPPTSTAAAFAHGKMVLPPEMEEPLTYEAQIQVRERFSQAQALSRDAKISVKGNQIRLGTSSVHEVVIIHL